MLLVAAALRFYAISSAPPGFHYDEAVNFIVAREIAFQGARPFPVFAAFNGREVLYYYVAAVAMRGIGVHIFTMHIVSGFMNLVTIAATIGLGRGMFGRERGWIIGILAAAFMTISFPQIFIARQAFRAVSLPLMQALCLWALYRGLQKREVSVWLLVAGVFGGGVLYTYMASRLFPVWLGMAMLVLLWADRKHWQHRIKQLAVFGIFLLIAAAPITQFYINNPDVFSDRLNQLRGDEASITYEDSVELHLQMFFIEGDPFVRYNDPLAPYFSLVGGGLLVLGYVVAVQRFIVGQASPLQRSSYALCLMAPLMVLPSVLALDGLPPSHMRSIGMVPMIFFLPALGLDSVLRTIHDLRFAPQLRQRAASALVVSGFAILTVGVWNRYDLWANNPELYYLNDGDMVDAGQWLEGVINDDTLVYVTSQHYDHPSLQISDIPGDNITYLLGDRLILPPPTYKAYLVETANTPLGIVDTTNNSFWAQFRTPSNDPLQFHNDNDELAFSVIEFSSSARPLIQNRTSETVGGVLRLLDTSINPAQSGSAFRVTSAWEILQPPPYDDFTPLFQLETPDGDVLDRVEPFMQRTTRWRPGEILIETVSFNVPVGTAPGIDYIVRVAWVGRASDQYVGRLDVTGGFAGLWTDVSTVEITRPNTLPEVAQFDIPIQRNEQVQGITLLGHHALPNTLRPGEILPLDLYWQRNNESEATEDITIALNDGIESTVLFQGAPVTDTYPFAEWRAGEIVVDRHRWRVPPMLSAGEYRIELRVGNDTLELGTILLEEVLRAFEIPAGVQPLNVNFSDTVQLAGYDLTTTTLSPSETVDVTLYWRSLAPTDLPFTVFVHLTDSSGLNQDQRDAQPRNNTYPVPLWIPGEVVADHYTLQLPSRAPLGTYTLHVGLYLQSTGQRLSIVDQTTDYWPLTEIEVEANE